MNNREYWEQRAARRIYDRMETAEEAGEEIRALYESIYRYIRTSSGDVFKGAEKAGLTEEEIRAFLTRNPLTPEALFSYIQTIPDTDRREALLAWYYKGSTQTRLAHIAETQGILTQLIPMLYREELRIHTNAYIEIVQDAYLYKQYDIQQYVNAGRFVTPLEADRIRALLNERWMGSNYSSRIWTNTERLSSAVKKEVMICFVTGKTEFEAWKAINAEFEKGSYVARRLVRTESAYLANEAQRMAYKDAGVDRYIFVATLDLRTSDTCRKMDGRNYPVETAQAGVNFPPMHPWCRSTTIAWIPKELRERMKRRARDPLTGRTYTVPATMTYREWYKKYVEAKDETEDNKDIQR